MRIVRVIVDVPVPELAGAKSFSTDYLGLRVEEFNLGWVARRASSRVTRAATRLRPSQDMRALAA